jgi:hypothetical protein
MYVAAPIWILYQLVDFIGRRDPEWKWDRPRSGIGESSYLAVAIQIPYQLVDLGHGWWFERVLFRHGQKQTAYNWPLTDVHVYERKQRRKGNIRLSHWGIREVSETSIRQGFRA